MAHDRKKIYQQTIDVIKENKLFFVEDVVAYISCSKPTFYDFFPVNSDKFNTIKEELDKNKIEIKVSMRSKWYKSENATLQLALMKLIGTEEEAHRLNGSHQKIEQKSDVTVYTSKEREARIEELKIKLGVKE